MLPLLRGQHRVGGGRGVLPEEHLRPPGGEPGLRPRQRDKHLHLRPDGDQGRASNESSRRLYKYGEVPYKELCQATTG